MLIVIRFEVPKAIFVESELFSVENDLLTPSFKLKRNVAQKKYRQQIDLLYCDLEKGQVKASL
jgi:long-chain acyl-CoA synthetase